MDVAALIKIFLEYGDIALSEYNLLVVAMMGWMARAMNKLSKSQERMQESFIKQQKDFEVQQKGCDGRFNRHSDRIYIVETDVKEFKKGVDKISEDVETNNRRLTVIEEVNNLKVKLEDKYGIGSERRK